MKVKNKLDKTIALEIMFSSGNYTDPEGGSQILKPLEITDELPEDCYIEIRELFPWELKQLEK